MPYRDRTRHRTTVSVPWTKDLPGGDGRRSDQQLTTGPFARARPRAAEEPRRSECVPGLFGVHGPDGRARRRDQ
ncbi:hypothetical protein BIV25_41645 [Streptomyces sp. MUSC 14]|nr:hypothetical protein BIV25_41645 [Streptomyces sp. MUSC 14]